MRKWFWIGVASIVLVALAVGGGIAQASRNTGVPAASATEHQWGGYLDSATLTRVATALGLTPAELTAQLQAGKTLAQVSKDKGVATEKVVEAILAPQKDQLQLRVKYGYITQAQSDLLLATAKQQAELTLNQTFTAPGITGTPSTPGYSADDMESYCNSVMGGAGMGGMMGGYGGGMMGGYGGGMMGGGMMGGWGTPGVGSGFGSWGRGMMGGYGAPGSGSGFGSWGSGMMGGYGAPGSGSGFGSWGRGMMGGW